jgi:hypothetical protein
MVASLTNFHTCNSESHSTYAVQFLTFSGIQKFTIVFVVQPYGEPKIYQFDTQVIFINDQILSLDIPVDNILFVNLRDPKCNLFENQTVFYLLPSKKQYVVWLALDFLLEKRYSLSQWLVQSQGAYSSCHQ